MNRNAFQTVFRYIRCALVLCLTIVSHRMAIAGLSSIDSWSVVRGQQLSSVAWSSDGSTVAFVATEKSPVWSQSMTKEECPSQPLPHLKSATIWLLRPGSAGQPDVLKRFLRLKPETGIPTALFWVSDKEIAWAADAGQDKRGFAFLCADTTSGKIRYLVQRRFRIEQTRTHFGPIVSGPWCPDDVYWDAKGRKLVFSGSSEPLHNAIWTYDLGLGKLKKVEMADVHGYPQCVTFWGIPGSKTTPLYFAGLRWPDDPRYEANDYGLWTTTSTDGRIDARNCRVVVSKRDGLFFPRLSRTGRLAWIQMERPPTGSANPENGYYLMVQDVVDKSKTHRIAISEDLRLDEGSAYGLNPALGCPFSWSPDGTKIAYADRDLIRIIEIGSLPGKH